MKAIVDRLEGHLAVLELSDGTFKEISKDKLPEGCREGDCLILDNDLLIMDEKETIKRKSKIKDLMNDLL